MTVVFPDNLLAGVLTTVQGGPKSKPLSTVIIKSH